MFNYDCVNVPCVIILSVSICISFLLVWISINTFKTSALVVSRCFPGGYNVKLYISRDRLASWLLAFLCCGMNAIDLHHDIIARITYFTHAGHTSHLKSAAFCRHLHRQNTQ